MCCREEKVKTISIIIAITKDHAAPKPALINQPIMTTIFLISAIK
jgi:hypothetical protein